MQHKKRDQHDVGCGHTSMVCKSLVRHQSGMLIDRVLPPDLETAVETTRLVSEWHACAAYAHMPHTAADTSWKVGQQEIWERQRERLKISTPDMVHISE
jgi:hypothetical protein